MDTDEFVQCVVCKTGTVTTKLTTVVFFDELCNAVKVSLKSNNYNI